MTEVAEKKPPVHVGETIVLNIEDIAFGGEGVARLEEFVVFIPFVLIGEKIEAEITDVKKRFARGRLIRVLKESPDRVQPECEYYGTCGGCQYQHIAYEKQLELKHKQIVELFRRVGGFNETKIAEVAACPKPYEYRNRIMVRSQWNKTEQRLQIGFVQQDCNWVVDIDHCKITEPGLSAQIQDVRDNPPPKGGLKVTLRKRPDDWIVPGDSFFQNNFHILPTMVEIVRQRLVSSGSRHLIDAYCGVGFFAINLASAVESFVGVELDKPAIRAAKQNALKHGAPNGDFVRGSVEVMLSALLERFDSPKTTVIIDPPRKGCFPGALTALREAKPNQIIYISCHPATLARDLNTLCEGGLYELEHVAPLDMFPQTQHVECVADLRLSQSAS